MPQRIIKEYLLTISGGSLTNDFIAVKNENEQLTVTGGKITSTEQSLSKTGELQKFPAELLQGLLSLGHLIIIQLQQSLVKQ